MLLSGLEVSISITNKTRRGDGIPFEIEHACRRHGVG